MSFIISPIKNFINIIILLNENHNYISYVVILISIRIFVYSLYYIIYDNYFIYFNLIVLIFIISILVLCVSRRYIIIFLGWDGLGVTSFFLIMYYNNWKSINNRVLTLLSNRVGDCLILLLFRFLIWQINCNTNIIIFSFSILLIILVRITKRAQVPISAWLPAAISAPTPVRALVHSSTLVRAGLIILIKFYYFLMSENFQFLLYFVGILTILIAGVSTLMEIDFKKLVALSTLRQIGMLFLIIGVGSIWLSFFHIISHAFFKRALFLVVGSGLHYIFGQQDWRFYNFIQSFRLSQYTIIFVTCICLCGLFFTSGFMSKDTILSYIRSNDRGICLFLIILISLLLTYIYSYRLLISIVIRRTNNCKIMFTLINKKNEKSSILLFSLSIIFSLWFFNNKMFFFLQKNWKRLFCFFYWLSFYFCY